MMIRRFLAAAFLAASLAPVAAMAQTATTDGQTQAPARLQSQGAQPDHARSEHAKPDHATAEHAKPDHATAEHAKPDHATAEHTRPAHEQHGGEAMTSGSGGTAPTPAGVKPAGTTSN